MSWLLMFHEGEEDKPSLFVLLCYFSVFFFVLGDEKLFWFCELWYIVLIEVFLMVMVTLWVLYDLWAWFSFFEYFGVVLFVSPMLRVEGCFFPLLYCLVLCWFLVGGLVVWPLDFSFYFVPFSFYFATVSLNLKAMRERGNSEKWNKR
jgi:hypothetical protein